MAQGIPRTWTTGELVTAGTLNTEIRDNMGETAPAKVTTAGDLVYATALRTLARLGLGSSGYLLKAGASAPSWGRVETTGVGVLQACRVKRTTDQTIPNGAWTAVTFDAEEFDPLGMHDLVTNTERIGNFAGGFYLIEFRVAFANNATGIRQARVLNNSGQSLAFREEPTPNAGYYAFLGDVVVVPINGGDYIYLQVYQTSGGDLASKADATLLTPRLSVAFLCAQA